MARKVEPEIKLIDHVEAGQVFIIMRVLIGTRRPPKMGPRIA
jgi:hypothetical protein